MFAAVKGDADALERLNRKHGSLARLIPTLQAFHTQAFATDFPINIQRRFDIILTFNPTATLRHARVF